MLPDVFDGIDLQRKSARRAEMIERARGRWTVPQVFIDGIHVGDFDELCDL